MNVARLVGLLLVVAVAMSLVSVASAAAESSNPLFLPAVGQSLVWVSGPSTLKAKTGQVVTCQKAQATGVVANALLAGNVFVHYLECTVVEKEGAVTRCTLNSKGAAAGLIQTLTLHGILGLILSPAPLDTGILFLPQAGKIWFELEASTNGSTKCTSETKFTGNLAGLITPIGADTTKGLLVFPKESIKKIDLTHGLGFVEPEFVTFTTSAVWEQDDVLTFGQATGIT